MAIRNLLFDEGGSAELYRTFWLCRWPSKGPAYRFPVFYQIFGFYLRQYRKHRGYQRAHGGTIPKCDGTQ